MTKVLGQFNSADLRKKLRTYDRAPFSELLALFLENMPSEEAIHQFANRYPDRYASALSNIGSLAGFSSKTEQTHNVNVNVGQMSDSQIEDELRRRMQALAVDGTVERVEHKPKVPLSREWNKKEGQRGEGVKRVTEKKFLPE